MFYSRKASLAFYFFSPTRLINSIKHEHSGKIPYVYFYVDNFPTGTRGRERIVSDWSRIEQGLYLSFDHL